MYDQEPRAKPKQNDSLDLAYLAFNVYRMCTLPILRCRFGPDGMGMAAFFALFLMLTVAAATVDKVMYCYIAVWMGFVIYRRIETVRMRLRGHVTHSRYRGFPWAAMCIPFVHKESTARGIIEPEICMVTGELLTYLSPNLGLFVLFSFIPLLLTEAIDQGIVEKRTQNMLDGEIEGRFYADRMKGNLR